MCGIVGYTGPRAAGPILLEGLRRLEYRGYDSAGIALVTDDGRPLRREEGRQARQPRDRDRRTGRRTAGIGLAHTRWATHGRPNDLNAHPHVDCTGRDHRDPQRDHRELPGAARRARGARARTSPRRPTRRRWPTSSRRPTTGDLLAAVRAALARAQGAYAVAVMHRARAGPPRRAPARTCRSSSASATARRSSPPTSPRSSPTPAAWCSSRRATCVDLRPWGIAVSGVAGEPRERGRHRGDVDARGGREGRLRALHAQGDPRAAPGAPPVRDGPGRRPTVGCGSRSSSRWPTSCAA